MAGRRRSRAAPLRRCCSPGAPGSCTCARALSRLQPLSARADARRARAGGAGCAQGRRANEQARDGGAVDGAAQPGREVCLGPARCRRRWVVLSLEQRDARVEHRVPRCAARARARRTPANALLRNRRFFSFQQRRGLSRGPHQTPRTAVRSAPCAPPAVAARAALGRRLPWPGRDAQCARA